MCKRLGSKVRKTLVRHDYTDTIALSRQCELLSIARGVVYYTPKPKPDDTVIANQIYDIWFANPDYGVRRMTDKLRLSGLVINRKKVKRIMREMGLSAIYPSPKTSVKDTDNQVFPYLLDELIIKHNNQVWMTDITYIRVRSGFVYLCALIDVHSRYIVGYCLDNTMDVNLCLKALDDALNKNQPPEIINSDQGGQFTSKQWVDKLQSCNIRISHTGKGRCLDNVYIERFWRSIKYEKIHLHDYSSVAELENLIQDYILHYNNERPHRSLNGKTPAMIYK